MKAISIFLTFAFCLFAVAPCFGGCAKTGTEKTDPPSSEPVSAGAPVSPGAAEGQDAAEGQGEETPSAAEYIENRLKEFDHVLHVYRDFADGTNSYTQKAWIGDSNQNIPEMREDADGRDGSTGIAAHLDLTKHVWGGYMFVNGVLEAGETVPKTDFGTSDAGLDLTGAEKLVFYARGELGGESIEFFMGGLGYDGNGSAPYADSARKVSLGYVTLSKEWERFEIPLGGCDLSRIGCGFGWVTNVTNNAGAKEVRFYLDDIHYEYPEARLLPMFLASYAPAPAGTDDAIINNFAYLYDNCAAAMALSYAGKHERARQIADAIVYALENDRYFTDGRLRNAYSCGNPQSFKGWFSARGKAFARMPGFYAAEDKTWYEDYYAVSTSTGNLAWAILSLCEVYENSPERAEYLDAAQKIADFLLTAEDGKGFAGGYEGWEEQQTRATYKSTEHNTDLIAAFGRLAKLTREQKYEDAAGSAKDFVLSMYDSSRGCFYTGTADDGVTANKDVIPLDAQTWTLLAMKSGFSDSAAVMDFVEANMDADGGYDFNTDKDGVWFEGTAQVGVVSRLLGNESKADGILDLLNANRLPDGSIAAADRDGVTTGFLVSGTDIPWLYGNRQHLGATAWLSFLQQNRNPFDY